MEAQLLRDAGKSNHGVSNALTSLLLPMQASNVSSGKGGPAGKGGKAAGKAKDPIQERKEAQLADEAQVTHPM